MFATPAPTPTPAYVSAHHEISTRNAQVQALFDRGLTLYYAYNGAQAVHVFDRAIALEPDNAMLYWGKALAAGPDINNPMDEAHFDAAHDAVAGAVAHEASASAEERRYIDAMAARYSGSWAQHDAAEAQYRYKMQQLADAYPLDDDAAALAAEAYLENDHNLWLTHSSTPDPNGPEPQIAALLRRILTHNPQHIMGNHLTVHTYEFSTALSGAVASAQRLDSMNFAPEDEHLAHMSAHTWLDAGNYRNAIAASNRAVALFQQYVAMPDSDTAHAVYFAHDLDLGFKAAVMIGDDAAARHFASLWDTTHPPRFGPQLAVREQRWSDVLAYPPAPADTSLQLQRALAYAMLSNIKAANETIASISAANPARSSGFMLTLIDAAIAMQQGNAAQADVLFQKAQAIEESTFAGEFLPVIPTSEIGGPFYLRRGEYAKAEAIYARALAQYPNDPRALLGRAQALQQLGRAADASALYAQYRAVWAGAS